ncbi:MAG: hypothetical protein FJ026_08350 [Chloroflexi bacterium]|nr:hypothetical protein [Chloroflexota bacterium]
MMTGRLCSGSGKLDLLVENECRKMLPAVALAAETLATNGEVDMTGFSPSQVRGLSNSLAPGPERHEPAERLGELARYLAWRQKKAKEGQGWHKAAETIKDYIQYLEVTASEVLNRAQEALPLPPLSESEHLRRQREIHLRLVEEYVYVLVAHYEAGRG